MIIHLFRVVQSYFRERSKSRRRSSKWENIKYCFLLKHDSCAACGSKNRLQVHHKLPFGLYPELELDENNLITLCMGKYECHFKIGHGESWVRNNKNIDDDIKELKANPENRKAIEKRIAKEA